MGVLTDFFAATPSDIERVPVTIRTRRDASTIPKENPDADPSPSIGG